MLSITGDGSANYMKLSALDSEPQPKLVIHAVEKRRVDVSAGSVPKLPPEEDLGLIEKLSRVPAAIKIQEIIERERTIAARCHMLGDQLAVPINFRDAGHDFGARGCKRYRHCEERAGRQHVVAVEPSEDFAGRDRHPFVDRVTLAAILFADDVVELIAVTFEHGTGLIGGAAVDHDIFQIRVALPEHRKNGFFDEPALIEGGGNNRDARPWPSIRQPARYGEIRRRHLVGPACVAGSRRGIGHEAGQSKRT